MTTWLFIGPSLLADAMLRDDRIYACTSTRIGGLLGTDLVVRGGTPALVDELAAPSKLQVV